MSLSKKSMTQARQIIFSQTMSLSIKRSAWVLFRHELTRVDPKTGRLFTRRKALASVLKWAGAQKSRLDAELKQLSPMQIKIVELLVMEGLTQKQIALRLKRDPNTIKHHCERIRKKVGVESLYQVVAVAVDQGWVTAPSANSHIILKG